MNDKRLSSIIVISILFVLLFTGCSSKLATPITCTILFEDNASCYFPNQIYEVNPSNDLTISIGIPHEERIATLNYEDYEVSPKTGESLSYDYYDLTLNHVRYSAVIRITTAPSYTTVYHTNSEGNSLDDAMTVLETSPHLNFNTLSYSEQYQKEGYLPIGWNTKSDGSGNSVGFGSRIDRNLEQQLDLYIEWIRCSESEDFSYQIDHNNEITITGYHGTGNLVIPSMIDGYPVTSIEENAFRDVDVDLMILPPSMKKIAPHAFGTLKVHDFFFYDNIEQLPETAFLSYQITKLHINAATNPVYSGSYFDTFSDKVDYLASLKDQPKIVLSCGSSARFGYDSSFIEASFPDYKVANMGVYAYSNQLPQIKIILQFMKEGDILLSSPEFDTIETQFCGKTDFDKETFCMMESNYDMLTWLDCTEFTNLFSSFWEYNDSRRDMEPRSYLECASYYDENGNLQTTASYNCYGDYIVYRKNNTAQKTFGVKRAYYHPKYFHKQDIAGLNAVYDAFTEQGITVFFTYSPRSEISISEDSTKESIQLLDEMLREQLHVNVISSIHASLMDPLYFYETDNHLSTEGVTLHTQQIIKDLHNALED